jgi:SWI/SNF-related matrix-associated actin-dependent regulator of chromatin subfamily A3
MTGTPVQNGLQDLRGLLHFLQFHPYSDPRMLDDNIFNYLNEDTREEGLRRFKTMFQAILIRRPTTMIDLPVRQDLTRVIDFSAVERGWYREVENAQIGFDALDGEGQSWLAAIQTISNLRLVCNLGLSSRLTKSSREGDTRVQPWDTTAEAQILYELYTCGIECSECKSVIFAPNSEDFGKSSPLLYYSTCLKIICPFCSVLNTTQGSPECSCGPGVLCTLQPLLKREGMGSFDNQTEALSPRGLSSKAQAVVSEIRKVRSEKQYVFLENPMCYSLEY